MPITVKQNMIRLNLLNFAGAVYFLVIFSLIAYSAYNIYKMHKEKQLYKQMEDVTIWKE